MTKFLYPKNTTTILRSFGVHMPCIMLQAVDKELQDTVSVSVSSPEAGKEHHRKLDRDHKAVVAAGVLL